MDKSLIAAFLLFPIIALGQTHTFPGNNVFPSTSTTDFNSGATVDFTGATVTGLAAGGTGTVTSITATSPIIVTPTPLVATGVISLDSTSKTNWDTAYSDRLKWNGGATDLVAATGRTSLGLDIGVNVQAYDADLTTWATKTPYVGTLTITTGKTFNVTNSLNLTGTDGSTLNILAGGTLGTSAYLALGTNVGTFMETPSSANLRSAVTDENGTGALLFSGATSPDFTTGITIGGTAVAANYINSSVTSQSPSTSDVYLAGSNIVVGAGDFKAKGQYRCVFDVVKSAGTGTIVLTLRTGTLGTTSDASRITFTFPAGTSVADTGTMEVVANWRTVGSGSSAVISGFCRAVKNTVTAAGLWNTTSPALTIVGSVSSGFNSSTATNIGLSINGGTAFAGTITSVQAQLQQP